MVTIDRVYQLIAEHTNDLVCIHDRENTIRFATASSMDILGHTADAILGKKLTEFLAPEFVNEMDFTTLRKFFDNPGSRIRYQVRKGENNLRWLETAFSEIAESDESEYSILSTTRDITGSVHLTEDLMEALAKEQAALAKEQDLSRFKESLYSVASHEFKTPLAVIQANIEMLKIKKFNPKLFADSLEQMEEEIDRLNSMIADMLQLKKLTMGETTVKAERIALVGVIEDVIYNDCLKAYPKVKTAYTIKGKEREMDGDYSLLRYIFSNLMINACKFSKKDSEVNVELLFETEFLKVAVKDQGIGIPLEEQEAIFGSFYRAKNVSNIQGTGVGLSVVKEFVALHGGKIYLDSKPNEGSTFYVELPYTITK